MQFKKRSEALGCIERGKDIIVPGSKTPLVVRMVESEKEKEERKLAKSQPSSMGGPGFGSGGMMPSMMYPPMQPPMPGAGGISSPNPIGVLPPMANPCNLFSLLSSFLSLFSFSLFSLLFLLLLSFLFFFQCHFNLDLSIRCRSPQSTVCFLSLFSFILLSFSYCFPPFSFSSLFFQKPYGIGSQLMQNPLLPAPLGKKTNKTKQNK